MSKILLNPALKNTKEVKLNEEWNNFMKKIGEVSGLVKDMASGDKEKSNAAALMADQILEGKVLLDEDVKLVVKDDRTVINKNAIQPSELNDRVS